MKKILFIAIIGSLTLSCQKAKENTENQEKAFTVERETFFANLKDPGEAAAQIQATAAEFDSTLMSDASSYSKYVGNEIKVAANMGVYLSDLNYSIAYQQTRTSKAYFTAAHELSKAIGIETNVLDFLMKRYSENLAQNDSVKNVVKELFLKSTRDLQGTDKEKLAGIAMSAYQIENLHLALGIIESYPKDMLPADSRMVILVPLYKVVLGQRNNVVTIYNFLKSYADPLDPNKNPNYPYYAQAFEELIAAYDKLNVEEKIANNQGTELLNDAAMKDLHDKVKAIRNKIVSVE